MVIDMMTKNPNQDSLGVWTRWAGTEGQGRGTGQGEGWAGSQSNNCQK